MTVCALCDIDSDDGDNSDDKLIATQEICCPKF